MFNFIHVCGGGTMASGQISKNDFFFWGGGVAQKILCRCERAGEKALNCTAVS